EVVDINAAQLRHQPIGASGRNAVQPEIINADLAPAADNVVSLGNLFEKDRNVRGVVLQVAVHGDDVLAARMIKTCVEACGLPEISPEPHNRDAAVHACDLT